MVQAEGKIDRQQGEIQGQGVSVELCRAVPPPPYSTDARTLTRECLCASGVDVRHWEVQDGTMNRNGETREPTCKSTINFLVTSLCAYTSRTMREPSHGASVSRALALRVTTKGGWGGEEAFLFTTAFSWRVIQRRGDEVGGGVWWWRRAAQAGIMRFACVE